MSNPVFLEEWEKYFKMSSVENFTRVLSIKVCTNKFHESVHGKTYNKTCTKRWISLHISSLIRVLANCIYLLWSLGLTKCLVQSAKTQISLHNCTFWYEHSLIVFTFDTQAVQSGINSVTATTHSDEALCWSYSMHLLWTPGYPRSLLYIVGRCTDWPESLLVARTL